MSTENKNSNIKKIIKKVLKNKIGRIVVLALIACIVLAVIMLLNYKPNQAIVDTTRIISTIENASELTTAKIHYTGMSEFEDSGIAIINRSDFIMVYEATARI